MKIFVEEPVGLEVLVPDTEADAHRRGAEIGSLDELLARRFEPDSDYARAYLAGTHLGAPRRVGLTALADAEVWLRPLLDWAGARDWTRLGADGAVTGLLAPEAAGVLRRPGDVQALALGPVPAGVLAASAVGERRDALPALRAALDASPEAAVLFPEPAHDGHDWSLFTTRPLRSRLVDAFGRHPAPEARRIVAPFQRARGEHKFYLEQWTLDALPDWAEEV
ncbi:MAG: hypothetical protein AAGJ11_19225 [Bacteroidota bacterium]